MRNGAFILADKKKKSPNPFQEVLDRSKPQVPVKKEPTLAEKLFAPKNNIAKKSEEYDKAKHEELKKRRAKAEAVKTPRTIKTDYGTVVTDPIAGEMTEERYTALRKAIEADQKAQGAKPTKSVPALTPRSEHVTEEETVGKLYNNMVDDAVAVGTGIDKFNSEPIRKLATKAKKYAEVGEQVSGVGLLRPMHQLSEGLTHNTKGEKYEGFIPGLIEGALHPLSGTAGEVATVTDKSKRPLERAGAGVALGARALGVAQLPGQVTKIVSSITKSGTKQLAKSGVEGLASDISPLNKPEFQLPSNQAPTVSMPAKVGKQTVVGQSPLNTTTQKPPTTPKTPQGATSSNVGSNAVKDLPIADKPVGDLVATANRVTDELLKQVGSDGRVKVKPEKMAKFAEDAKTVNVDDLIAELGEKPRTLQPHEELALGARLSESMRKYDDALNQFHESAGKGNVPKSHNGNLDAMRGQVDEVIKAGGNAGTGWHQTGMARQALIRSDYSLQGLIQKAYKKADKAGIKLDKHTRAYYEEAAARYKQAESELADIKARAAENPTKFTEKEGIRTARRTSIIKEHEDLLTQIKGVKQDFGKGGNFKPRSRQGGAVNVKPVLDTVELMGLYGKLGWNLAKQGHMNVGDIFIEASKIAKEAGHKITKQGFIDAMDDIRLKRAGISAAQAAKANLKARLALNNEVERGSTRGIASAEAKAQVKEVKAASRLATLEQVKASAKANKLKGEIADIEKMLKDGEYYMAKAEKAGDTAEIANLKAQKKTLSDQLNEAKAIQRLESQISDIDNMLKPDADVYGVVKNNPLEPSAVNALKSKKAQLMKELGLKKDAMGSLKPSELVRDENSLARMDRKMKDLNTMIETGDYYGTGVTRKSSVLSDAVALKEYQLAKLQAEVDHNIDQLGKSKYERTVEEAFNLSRGLKLGLDMGALGRQGLDILYTNPRVWFDGAKAGVQSMSKVKAHSINAKHLNDPEVVRWMKDGLAVDKLGSHGEEGFGSTVLKLIPGHAPLERFHVTFQNEVRIGMAKYMSKAGDLTPLERKGVADLIGAMTGRSNLLKEPHKLVNRVFTAPKMYAGHAEVMSAWLNPKYSPVMGGMGKSSKAVRAIVARRTIGRLGMLVGLKTFTDKLGGDFSLNPDDSDFLKMRIGDRVYDVGGGYTPYYRAVFSTLNDFASPSRNHSTAPVDTVANLAKTKVSPLISGASAIVRGKDFVGEPRFRDKYDTSKFKLDDAKSWFETLGSITVNDIYDMTFDRDKYKDSSRGEKRATLGLAFAGVGASSFDDKKPRKTGAEGTVMGQALSKLGIDIVKRTPEKAKKESQAVIDRERKKNNAMFKKKRADVEADKFMTSKEKAEANAKIDEEERKVKDNART